MRYTVKWVIEVEAPNHQEAAIHALRLMRLSDKVHKLFHVKPAGTTGAPKRIEL